MQTEHHEAPDADYIETQVFREGGIVLSKRFQLRQNADASENHLASQLRKIHHFMVEKLRAGQLRREEESSRSVYDDRKLRKLAIRLLRAVGNRVPESDLSERLSSAANLMALIGGQNANWSLRNDDLHDLLRFRDETLELVRSENFDLEAARDLWRRLAATASRLARVNDRKHLIKHDIELCRRFLGLLKSQKDAEPFDHDQLPELRPLWGRDEKFDQLLDEPAKLTIGVVKHELARILASLEGRHRDPRAA